MRCNKTTEDLIISSLTEAVEVACIRAISEVDQVVAIVSCTVEEVEFVIRDLHVTLLVVAIDSDGVLNVSTTEQLVVAIAACEVLDTLAVVTTIDDVVADVSEEVQLAVVIATVLV